MIRWTVAALALTAASCSLDAFDYRPLDAGGDARDAVRNDDDPAPADGSMDVVTDVVTIDGDGPAQDADVLSIDADVVDADVVDRDVLDGDASDASSDRAEVIDAAVTCPTGLLACTVGGAAVCTNVQSDNANCGECGRSCDSAIPNAISFCAHAACTQAACNAGYDDCDRAAPGCESNLGSDPANCGGCGNRCAFPNAAAACMGGVCRLGTCSAGFADCDRNPANGCEVNVATDATNCATCGTVCSAPAGRSVSCQGSMGCVVGAVCSAGLGDCDAVGSNGCESTLATDASNCGACGRACDRTHGTPTCAGGLCTAITCAAGYGNCDGDVANGCEVELATDGTDCGACGNRCALPNSTARCASGACAVGACTSGFGDCDGRAANGCEASLGADSANCGACGRVCAAGLVCSAGACVCPSGTTSCGGACVNLMSSDANCGACGRVCAGGQVCASGACACPSGQTSCGAGAAARCVDLRSDNGNCGGCGTACSAIQRCAAGACVTSCPSGTADCTAMGAGCVDTSATAQHCGGCGMACSTRNVSAACASGACAGACATGFADCNGDKRTDGCEVDVTSSVSHCGACGRACALSNATAGCSAGVCTVASCGAGYGNCNATAADGCETNLNTSAAHCGACGRACALTNATAVCTAGACAVSACSAGYGNCDGVAANGCETDLTSNVVSCGACGTVCSTNNITRACTLGACRGACNPGFADCNANKQTDGCETNTTTSAANCGACGNACLSGQTCVSSACVACGGVRQPACGGSMCNASLTACGGTCVDLSADSANCSACGNACGGGQVCSGGVCQMDVTPPRPLSPVSVAIVTSRRPALRWQLASGTVGAQVELCRDRACATSITTTAVTGSSFTPAADLPVGPVFWRLRGRTAGSTGASYSPTWEFVVGALSATVNTTSGYVSDFNGDGRADVAIGASLVSDQFGSVYVYHGAGAGPAGTPTTSLRGFVNSSAFGDTVSNVGDVNGDGYADLAVTAPNLPTSPGYVYIYHGSAAGVATVPATTLTGTDGTGVGFAVTMDGAGDVNGDGYSDIAVGTSETSDGGRVHLYLGGPSGVVTTASQNLVSPGGASERFGYRVALAGNANGDAYADLIVGAYNTSSGAGRAYLYLGGASGVPTSPSQTIVAPDGAGGNFGYRLSWISDVNGDGYSDVAIAAPAVMSGTGRVHVYQGASSGLVATPARSFTGLDVNGSFGDTISNAGDINGDGYSDVAFGADGAGAVQGNVFIFRGSSTGLPAIASQTLSAVDSPAGRYGAAIGIPGDINADGFADLLVGAPSLGRVYLYRGIATGVTSPPGLTIMNPSGTAYGLFGGDFAGLLGGCRGGRSEPGICVCSRGAGPRV